MIVGYQSGDDAGVYAISDDLALVQTVDFFTPIVDDPYDFGRIAAANSFSDVYAMGGTPITALNITAFPMETLGIEVLEEILRGGSAIAQQAGVAVLGGHTIKDSEPKYGMAVTGTVARHSIVTNGNARPGDILILSKPLGTGVLSTALKREILDPALLQQAVEWMTSLNDAASRAMLAAGAHAATDITGFGLLGHAGAMARASGAAIELRGDAIPLMDGVLQLIADDCVPSGTEDNARDHARFTTFRDSVAPELRIALSDAQTSGGLLVALPPDALETFRSALHGAHALGAVIGEVRSGQGITVR